LAPTFFFGRGEGLKKNYETLLWPNVEKICTESEVTLYDIRWVKEEGTWIFRVFIDVEGGVNMDHCVKVSRALDVWLDEADPIAESYSLEVSSPGIDRELRRPEHFEAALNGNVKLRLKEAVNGKKTLTGILKAYDANKLVIDEIDIDRKIVRDAKLLAEI